MKESTVREVEEMQEEDKNCVTQKQGKKNTLAIRLKSLQTYVIVFFIPM